MAECSPAEGAASLPTSNSSHAERKLKCRKCRQLLLEQPPYQLSVEEGQGEAAAVYSLHDEDLPQWVNAAIEQVERLTRTGTCSNAWLLSMCFLLNPARSLQHNCNFLIAKRLLTTSPYIFGIFPVVKNFFYISCLRYRYLF
jgi:hypothetical protein